MKTNIENKINIAADAGELVSRYLDELIELLVINKIPNIYHIVADTEDIIVDLIKNQGSPTKLGSDVVMKLIHEHLGTPEEYIYQFVEDEKIIISEINEYSSTQNTSETLVRKQKKGVGRIKSDLIKDYKIFSKFTRILPTLFLLTLLLYTITVYNYSNFNAIPIFYPIMITSFAVLLLSYFEVKDGKTGQLIFSKLRSRQLRNINKSIIMFSILLFFYRNKFGLNRQIYHYLRDDLIYTETLPEYPSELREILFYFISLFILYNFIITIRDHRVGMYPLEPKKVKIIKYFTIPYILLNYTIFIQLFNVYYEEVYYPLVVITLIWIKVRKYPVSIQFHTVLYFNLILSLGDPTNISPFHTFYAGVIYLLMNIGLMLVLKLFHNPNPLNWFTNIKNRKRGTIETKIRNLFSKITSSYNDYYDTFDKKEEE